MSAERKAIRNAMKDLLLAGNTAAADRVFASRGHPLQKDELPAILVYTLQEGSEVFEASPKRYRRTVQVAVDCIASLSEHVDDALDDLAEQIETLVAADDTLGGTASDCELTQTEMSIAQVAEDTVMSCRLTFSVQYLKDAPGDLSDTLDDFKKVDLKVDVAPADGQLETRNTIELPQN